MSDQKAQYKKIAARALANYYAPPGGDNFACACIGPGCARLSCPIVWEMILENMPAERLSRMIKSYEEATDTYVTASLLQKRSRY